MIIEDENLCILCFEKIEGEGDICDKCKGKRNNEIYPTALAEGAILNEKYIVGKVLGKGGFGITYLAYDPVQKMKVAIKEYFPDSLAHRDTGYTSLSLYTDGRYDDFKKGEESFFNEAKTLSRLEHNENIVKVFEMFRENETSYYVMEYLEGMDLRCYLKSNGKLSEEKALEIMNPVFDAVAAVHKLDFLHRDISPDNILLCNDGGVKLIDFGSARQVIGQEVKTLTVMLKHGFAPFEQYKTHGEQGPWTDIYSLGATLYYIVTGHIPPDAPSRMDNPELDMTDISDGISWLIRGMMNIQPEHRFRSISEVKNVLANAHVGGVKSADEDRPICQCCEEKPCSDKYGEDYPYCDDCRKLMVKYPIRFSGVVAFLLTFVLFIGGCFLTQNELMDSLSVYEASSYYSSGHITTAADTYSQYLSSHGSKYISKRALREAIRTYYKLGATNEITDLVDKYYSDKKLDKETQEIYDSCIRINNTTDAVYQPIVMPALYGYVDPQSAIDQLNKFISENEKSKDKVATPTDAQAQPEYDTMIAEYFIYYIMVYGDFDNSERYEQIKKIAEKGGEDYIWMYAGSLSMMAAEMGELEVVESCCELIKENNLDDVTAYTTLAHYYFRQKDIDADKILEICKQADEAFPTGAEMTHYRYYAAANLLKGEYDKALEAMEKLTASGVQNVSDANLYAVCGIAAGKDEVYDEMVETLANANFEISKNVDKYKAGKISIEKLFETAGGDFI